jgi:AcrR family transcriptional regulator
MPVFVEHEKRREEILDKALDVFIREGYENTTFQKIAAECEITRTTLYQYFNNKDEIFFLSIKQFLEKIEEDIVHLVNTETLTSVEKIKEIVEGILRAMETNHRLISIALDYIVFHMRNNSDTDATIKRRIIKFRHYISGLLIDGMNTGEIKKAPIKDINEIFNALFESGILRIAMLGKKGVPELRMAANSVVNFLSTSEVS